MPIYRYKVADHDGNTSVQIIEGLDESDARRRVEKRGMIPIKFLGENESSGFVFRKRFDVLDFTDRFVPLLNAGIPLANALSLLEESSETELDRRVIQELRQGLHEGRKLSELIKDRSQHFPRIYASVVSAGEEAGVLPEVLKELQRYLQMTKEMKTFIATSSVYPVLVVLVCISVMSILMGVVVPRFAKVILSTGKEPGMGTAALLKASVLIRDYWQVGVFALMAGILIAMAASRREDVRAWWDGFVLKIPVLNSLLIKNSLAHFIRTMAVLLRNGVHLLDAVRIATSVIPNRTIQSSIQNVSGDLRQGDKLSAALGKSPYMTTMMIQMLRVGENTGQPEDMMRCVAEKYDDEIRQQLKSLLAWFEPVVIILLGGIIGTIVLTLFLTILDMQSGL